MSLSCLINLSIPLSVNVCNKELKKDKDMIKINRDVKLTLACEGPVSDTSVQSGVQLKYIWVIVYICTNRLLCTDSQNIVYRFMGVNLYRHCFQCPVRGTTKVYLGYCVHMYICTYVKTGHYVPIHRILCTGSCVYTFKGKLANL